MFMNDFFNLVLVCKVIEPSYGRTRTRGFFSILRVVPLTTSVLSINLLKHFRVAIFKKICFRKSNSVCNLVEVC